MTVTSLNRADTIGFSDVSEYVDSIECEDEIRLLAEFKEVPYTDEPETREKIKSTLKLDIRKEAKKRKIPLAEMKVTIRFTPKP